MSANLDSTPIVDWMAALQHVNGSRDMLQEIVRLFVDEECPRLMQDIQTGLLEGDAAVVGRAAHTLKSSAGIFEATPVFEAAEQLESMGRNRCLDNAQAVWNSLRAQIERLTVALEDFDSASLP